MTRRLDIDTLVNDLRKLMAGKRTVFHLAVLCAGLFK
jgi:hypothetical protein